MTKLRQGRIVYSTDPDFAKRQREDAPRNVPSLPPEKQVARLSRSRAGRKGKTVTVISGLQLDPGDLEALTKTLKTLIGAGGTVKDGDIEIQGDHRERIAAKLAEMGYKVKLVAG